MISPFENFTFYLPKVSAFKATTDRVNWFYAPQNVFNKRNATLM